MASGSNEQKINDYVERAKQAIRKREFSSACEYLRGALALQPDNREIRRLLNQSRAGEADAKWNFLTRSMADLTASLQYVFGMKEAAGKTLELLHKSRNNEDSRKPSKRLAMMYGQCARSAGDKEEAIEAFEFVRRKFDSNDGALFALKDLYKETGQLEKAVDVLSQLQTNRPKDQRIDKELRDTQAQRFSEVGVPKDLSKRRAEIEKERVEKEEKVAEKSEIQTLREQLQEDPGNRDLQFRLAELLVEVGKAADALAVYDALLEQDAEDRAAWERAAPLCIDLERWGDAAMAFERLLEFDPENIDYKQHYLESRRKELKAVLQEQPDDLETKTALDAIIAEEAHIKGDLLENRIRQNPGNVDLLIEYAGFLMAHHRWDEALQQLQKGRATPQRIFQILKMMGACFREQGMMELAEENLSEAISKAPPYSGLMRDEVKEAYYLLGRSREDLNDIDGARDCYKTIMENDIAYRDTRSRYMELAGRKKPAGE